MSCIIVYSTMHYINRIDKIKLLQELYNCAPNVKFFCLVDDYKKRISYWEARRLWYQNKRKVFDRIYSKNIKVDLSGMSFDPWYYDREHGRGLANKIMTKVIKSH